MSALLAVCDVLVIGALDKLGKRIVRSDRHRYVDKGNRPWYLCHTVWRTDDATVSKTLHDAWNVVPALLAAHGPCPTVPPRHIVAVLDAYVHDLAVTGNPHSLDELALRLRSIGLPVYVKQREPCYA